MIQSVRWLPSGTATDNPNLAPLRDHGTKLLLWHGFSDQLIFAEDTIDYYDRVVKALGGGYKQVPRSSLASSWRLALPTAVAGQGHSLKICSTIWLTG